MRTKEVPELLEDLELAHRKLSKLKALILLVDPAVSTVEMNSISATQWSEFIKEFPDEGLQFPGDTGLSGQDV